MRNEGRVVFCPRGFQHTMSIAFGKIMLRPLDVGHETFLGQDFSDPLMRIRLGSAWVVEYAYVEDLASIVGICRCACNTTEAGEEPFQYVLNESAVISSRIMPVPTDAIKWKKSNQPTNRNSPMCAERPFLSHS